MGGHDSLPRTFDPSGRAMIRLASLHVYPLKSAAGLSADAWEVDAFGLRYDRRWMVVDGQAVMISQRTHPRLALVRPSLGDDTLRLETGGMPALELRLEPPAAVSTTVVVWRDTCAAVWGGERAARWISDVLDAECNLVYMPEATFRAADPHYAPEATRVSFADAFPFLLLSEESLADLNARLATPVPMNRFRPNLVIAGGGAYAEDALTGFRIGDVGLRAVKPCDRCVLTTTDQATAERGVEPLRTLATYRTRDRKVLFGQNVVHEGPGRLEVGEALLV